MCVLCSFVLIAAKYINLQFYSFTILTPSTPLLSMPLTQSMNIELFDFPHQIRDFALHCDS
jgi:hypothetical protein